MTATLDPKKYGRLLADALPAKIDTEAENERVLAIIDGLMAKDEEKLSPEETALLRLLAGLVEEFEESAYPEVGATASPLSVLSSLMDEHGLKQKDLLDIFGSSGTASEVFSGKRGISKAQAKKLGLRFRLSADLFI